METQQSLKLTFWNSSFLNNITPLEHNMVHHINFLEQLFSK